MYIFISIIDFLIILLLLRFLIKPLEVYSHPIYSLIYRVTDFVLIPSKHISKKINHGILLTILGLLVINGAFYVGIKPMPFSAGIGMSLLSLSRFIFQAYVVIWFISILSQRGYRTSVLEIFERAFLPFYSITRRFGIPRNLFYLFVFLSLWLLYSFLSFLIVSFLTYQTGFVKYSPVHSLAEGLLVVLALFPFPGFFSVIIIVGALLSWVSPDPSNPIVQSIYAISEPLLSPFRRLVPLLAGIDISPIIALLCFHIIGELGRLIIGSITSAI